MDYPEWAPRSLVEYHKILLEDPLPIIGSEDLVARLKADERFKDYTEKQFNKILTEEYRTALFLPENEAADLLGKLLTDIRMTPVWASLKKRTNEDHLYHQFWTFCSKGIIGWRGHNNITPKIRRKNLIEIEKLSEKLVSMMDSMPEFSNFTTASTMSDKEIERFIDELGIEPDYIIDDMRLKISTYIPQPINILYDIQIKALNHIKDEPLVKKPNSSDAPTHYFVRTLSNYLQRTYNQPLNSVVAITTSVILDTEIDEDRVRKLIK